MAAEYLRRSHGNDACKETVRQRMIRGKLWSARKEKVKKVHAWRPRRSRFGELVQWASALGETDLPLLSENAPGGLPLS